MAKWVLTLLILFGFSVSWAGNGLLNDARNIANGLAAVAGGAGYCGEINLHELDTINCHTNTKFQGNREDFSRLIYYAEQLVLNDLAAETQASIECNLPLLDDYHKSMKDGVPTGPSLELNQAAFDSFKRFAPIVAAAQKRIDDLEASRTEQVLSRGAKELTAQFAEQVNNRIDAEQNRLRSDIKIMCTSVPLGTDANIRKALIKYALKGSQDFASFNKVFSPAVLKVQDEMKSYEQDLVRGKQIVSKDGYFFYNFERMPVIREELMMSNQYEQRLRQMGADDSTTRKLLCRRDAEFVYGRKNIDNGLTALSILSIGATFGATTLGAVGLEGGVGAVLTTGRVADLTLGFGLGIEDMGEVASACAQEPIFASVKPSPPKCTAKDAFDGLAAKSAAGDCLSKGAAALAKAVLSRGAKVVDAAADNLAAKTMATEADTAGVRAIAREGYIDESHLPPKILEAADRADSKISNQIFFKVTRPYNTSLPLETDRMINRIGNTKMRTAVRRVSSYLRNAKAWGQYTSQLLKDAAQEMIASGDPALIKLANEGQVNRESVLKVLAKRARARGEGEISYIHTEDHAGFRDQLGKGPFIDKVFTSRSKHGADSHLLQRDFISGELEKALPGESQKFYEFMASDKGIGIWRRTFDLEAGHGTPNSPNIVRDMLKYHLDID